MVDHVRGYATSIMGVCGVRHVRGRLYRSQASDRLGTRRKAAYPRHAAKVATARSRRHGGGAVVQRFGELDMGCLPSEPLLWNAPSGTTITYDGSNVVWDTRLSIFSQ